jgi:hypothetical protein
MRSVTRTTAAALGLALAACGNYSTEDLRVLAALPTRSDLSVAVPADASSGAATVCPIGPADVWLRAKPTSDNLNAGVRFVVSLIDVVRHYPPTAREKDLRRWGPFPDEKHPGREIQIVIERTYPAGPDGAPVHDYRFEGRRAGDPAFDPLIAGTFEGASSSRGHGTVDLYFENFWSLGMNDDTTPHGTMLIAYDRVSDPVTIALDLTNDGFGVVQFGYGFAGYADGRGRFDYRFRTLNGDVLTVVTGYDAAGAGRAAVAYAAAGGGTGSFRQCWDSSACLTYVDDPFNFSCIVPPCSGGSYAACPVDIPAPWPFPPP